MRHSLGHLAAGPVLLFEQEPGTKSRMTIDEQQFTAPQIPCRALLQHPIISRLRSPSNLIPTAFYMEFKAASEQRDLPASLRRCNGTMSETSYRLRGAVLPAGRQPENALVIEGPVAGIVSTRHLEVRRVGNVFRNA